ncbi:nucleolar MIF4G domain-containing protein 1 [Andrena cerasifolii]|uniref:nucleolar MIF4G domain-containing protein 1 n=1 Tax=Andrena cerasifolii TaxID=2819439 RepID=UPI004037FA73
MSSFKRSKVKSKGSRRGANLKLLEKSRKQVRKELRKQKKIDKAIYFRKKGELRDACAGIDEREDTVTVVGENKDDNSIRMEKKPIEDRRLPKLELKKKNQKNQLLKAANLEEDKIIKKLEKQLKLNKRRKKTIPKSFAADGLDYLLDFCLEGDRKCVPETERELLENEFNTELKANLHPIDDICISNTSSNSKRDERNVENVDDSFVSIFEDESVNDSDWKVLETKRVKKCHTRHSEINGNIDGDKNDLWEDIYGRKRDGEGNIIQESTKYVPPAVRVTADDVNTDDKRLHLLKKQLKGCLNRVAEHNIHTIANQVEGMYMTNSRNNMNHLLSSLVFEALVTDVLTPDRLICEHMMLIAILHANVGVEVGAHFLEILVKKLVKMMDEPQDVEKKQLDNAIIMISHLYNFKVYGHKLLYQILHKLVRKFSEKEIELILLILKTVGFLLRKDDPIALKEFIQDLQERASGESKEGSRVKFMLDVLLAIKNNNMSKIPQYDPSHMEHLKKVIKSVIRKGNMITQFNVSLEDLLHVDENGKWWVIGSAWSGSNTVDNQGKVKKRDKLQFGRKILELAQKQRMNTDTRRNIFCILMTAEDYMDAFEKLHHLGLKDRQGEEIVHVLMHCCLQENKFNPYYAILAQKLCEYNRKYQLTIQYSLWDKLKTLESYGTKQLKNLARFLTHLFIEKSLALSILKVIQFTELDKHTMKLLSQIILGILLYKNEQACLQVFERISISPQLQAFREGLRLFINHFLIKSIDTSSMLGGKEIMLKKRAEMADKILILHDSKAIF